MENKIAELIWVKTGSQMASPKVSISVQNRVFMDLSEKLAITGAPERSGKLVRVPVELIKNIPTGAAAALAGSHPWQRDI